MRGTSSQRSLLDALPVLVPAALLLLWIAHESYQMDFRAFYVAGKSFLGSLDPYRNHAGRGAEFLDSANGLPGSRFYYPPTSALLFAPLATLPYDVAKQLFSLLLALALLAVAVVSADGAEPTPWEAFLVAAVSMPVLTTFERGQVDLLLVGAVLVAWRAAASRRGAAPAAALVALAGSVKIVPLALAGLWAAGHRLRLVGLVVLFSLVLWLLPLPLVGGEVYRSFVSQAASVGEPLAPDARLVSLQGFVGFFSPDGVGLAVTEDEAKYVLRYDLSGHFVHRVNPLALLGRPACVVLGAALMAYLAHRTRRTGAFSQLVATLPALNILNPMAWTMGLVWFLPFFLSRYGRATAIGRLALLVPLFLPGPLTVFGFGPEAVLSIAVVAGFLAADEGRRGWTGLLRAPAHEASPVNAQP